MLSVAKVRTHQSCWHADDVEQNGQHFVLDPKTLCISLADLNPKCIPKGLKLFPRMAYVLSHLNPVIVVGVRVHHFGKVA